MLNAMPEALPSSKGSPVPASPPVPPRFWWLKRVSVLVAVVLVLVGVSRWCWGVYAWGALQAEIDRLRAAGEPMDAADFDLSPVPDERNAAIPLKEAAAIQASLGNHKSSVTETQPADTAPVDLEAEEEHLAAVARIRELVREARLRPEVNWGWTWKGLQTRPPSLMPFGHMTSTLHEVATRQLEEGDRAGALDTLEDLLALGDRVDAHRMLLASCVNHGVSQCVVEAIEEAMPHWRDSAQAGEHELLQPARAAAFISRLLDDYGLHEGVVWGLHRERFLQLEGIRLVADGYTGWVVMFREPTVREALLASFYRPMAMLDGVRVLQHASTWVDTAKAASWPEVLRESGKARGESPRGLKRTSRALSPSLIANVLPTLRSTYHIRARRRMAAVGLGVRLYEAEHGRLPETLQELVLDYLPYVPEDPLAEDGELVQYSPELPHPHLYCQPPDQPSLDERSSAGQPQVEKASPLRFYLYGKPAVGASGSATQPADQP